LAYSFYNGKQALRLMCSPTSKGLLRLGISIVQPICQVYVHFTIFYIFTAG